MRLSFLAVLVGLASPLAAQPAYVGNWAGDPAWCEFQDKIGSQTPAPIAITIHEWLGYENSCDIVDANEFSMNGGWILTLECFSEGEQNLEERVLLLDGPDVLWQWWGSGEPLKFTRCEGS
jgi:hypothetical protein